ncbi:fatty-acid amide hydrolase (amidase) [Colletotrichum plurivorum]|uniref:amidase n=1 Tax=Colletotrichum plurivorum TaxID=2175906 RepID=A0A8H6JHZ8_9PEZI|nr:fatty-acid amide hydrolase (amidase) [Colletotrichum plurivorum]
MGSLKADGAPWELAAARKRESLAASIPAEWRVPKNLLPPESQEDVTGWPEASGWLTPEELAITESTAADLLPKLASGALKSVDVTKAFCKRAVAAHQLTNCLSETCFDRALSTAAALDEHLARTGKPIGPFHGLPVSLKDNFNLRGLDATVGFASHVDSPAASDAALAQLLEEAGAVFYVKTNVPTAMMIAESVNNVFGRTVNPRNRNLTSGGSSGGESALISFKGSPLGVGTDIGGSLRIPAACTGIFTLRPSFGRFPTLGCRSGMAGQEAVQSVNGPMTRTITDLEMYCRAVVGSQTWLRDPRCVPIPWREVKLPAKLRVAVMWHDGIVRPTAPVARALRETVAKLEAAGVDIVDWDPVDQQQGLSLLERMFIADGGISIRKELEKTGEPFRPEMEAYSTAKEVGTYDMWQIHLERTAFQKRYLDRWNAAGIDAILCPTTPFASVKNGTFKHVGYTGVYNILDYACVSFPTGLSVDKSVDTTDPAAKPLGPVCEAIQAEYDADAVHGMPISLQLVARRLEEEKAIAMVKHILDVI